MQKLSELLLLKSKVLAQHNKDIQPLIEKLIKSRVRTVKLIPDKESILIVVIHPAQIHQIKTKTRAISQVLKDNLGWKEPKVKQSYFLDSKY